MPGELALRSKTLDATSLRCIAERELGEKANIKKKALKEMKDWIKESNMVRSPSQILGWVIKMKLCGFSFQICRSDNTFILRFLRMKKFQLEDTQNMLEKYVKMRTQHPTWFHNLDVRDPKLNELIQQGFLFALPNRDSKGRRVVFSRACAMDSTKFTAIDIMRIHFLTFEALLEDEDVQINGLTYVLDERDVSWSHISVWTPSQVSKAFSNCERALPLKHREIHLAHLPWTMSLVFQFAKSLLSKKLSERFQCHSDFDQVTKHVPKDILPRECGGTIPMDDMIEKWIRELESKRLNVLSYEKIKHNQGKTIPTSNNNNNNLQSNSNCLIESSEDQFATKMSFLR